MKNQNNTKVLKKSKQVPTNKSPNKKHLTKNFETIVNLN